MNFTYDKATNFKFCTHSQNRSEQKPIKNFSKSGRGRTRGLSKIFRVPICRAHGAVGHLCGNSAFLYNISQRFGVVLWREGEFLTKI